MTDPKTPKDSSPLFERPPGYHSYLMRFWEERSDELPLTVWRFSLEDPSTDQRYGFPTLEALVDWVKAKINSSKTLTNDPL